MTLPSAAHRARVSERHKLATSAAVELEAALERAYTAYHLAKEREREIADFLEEIKAHLERAQTAYYQNELVRLQTQRELEHIDRAYLYRDRPKSRIDVLVSVYAS